MKIKKEFVEIKKNEFDRYKFNSSQYNKSSLSECELMVLLGAVFGTSITNKHISDGSYITIEITLIEPE